MSHEIIQTENEKGETQTLLMVNNRFLAQVVKEIRNNPNPGDETAGFILGFRDSSEPKKTLLVPIESFTPPDSGEIERHRAHLNIGGPIAGIYQSWQVKNWQKIYSNFYRDFPFNPEDPNTQLSLLGIWHKHPGNYIGFSGTDDATIDNILRTPGKMDFLFPVATDSREYLSGSSTPPPIEDAIRLKTNDNHFVDIKFYYRSKEDGQTKILKPMMINQNILPHLAEIPWYVENPSRFKEEVEAFKKDGYGVAINLKHKQDLHFPDTWLVITHKDLNKKFYLRMSSFEYPTDGLFLITPNNPDTTKIDHDRIVLFAQTTIAETIKPIIFNNNNHEGTK
ncbi:MAG: hypothetical protein NTZ07_04385 [Candidatus Woesebacteria bacterium]|nr:hypothetical protein [Candidatus Woesebacteria bacterium]